MPLATKNGSLIVKDGTLAESCGCCGDWYCYNEVCESCLSGNYPTAINTRISFQVNDGTTSFPARLVLYTTLERSIGACATYLYSVGAGANPNSTGYDGDQEPAVSFTYQDIGPPVFATFKISLSLELIFGGACFRGYETAQLTPNAVWLGASDLRSAVGGSLKFDLNTKPHLGAAVVSTSAPLCYGDYAGELAIPITAGSAFKRYPGTFSVAVESVE